MIFTMKILFHLKLLINLYQGIMNSVNTENICKHFMHKVPKSKKKNVSFFDTKSILINCANNRNFQYALNLK